MIPFRIYSHFQWFKITDNNMYKIRHGFRKHNNIHKLCLDMVGKNYNIPMVTELPNLGIRTINKHWSNNTNILYNNIIIEKSNLLEYLSLF